MTKVAEIERIRWAHFREGVSILELARTFHRSRRTIRRALADPGPWSYRRRRPVVEPVMGPVAEIVTRWLEDDLQRPSKQRHPAKRIWERLVAEYHFAGAETTVRQWVRAHRPTSTRAVTLPLAHDPKSISGRRPCALLAGTRWCNCSARAWPTRRVMWCALTSARTGRPGWTGMCTRSPPGAGLLPSVGTTTRAP